MLPTAAVGLERRVTTLDLKTCNKLKETQGEGSAVSWSCPGAGGYFLHFVDDGARMMVGFSASAKRPPRRLSSLAPFNSLFKDDETQTADVGWLMDGPRPLAAVVLFHTQTGSGPEDVKGQVLVVYKLSNGDGCQLAKIDAVANADAERIAYAAAEAHAKSFDCRRPPRIEGSTGKSPM
jgi:hypothetical protein